jgi:hypothetical protein
MTGLPQDGEPLLDGFADRLTVDHLGTLNVVLVVKEIASEGYHDVQSPRLLAKIRGPDICLTLSRSRGGMPRGRQGQKRPADTVSNAIHVTKILTGERDSVRRIAQIPERDRN